MDGYTADEELVVSTETHPRPRHRWTSRLGSGSIRRAPSVGQVAAAADVMMLALSAAVTTLSASPARDPSVASSYALLALISLHLLAPRRGRLHPTVVKDVGWVLQRMALPLLVLVPFVDGSARVLTTMVPLAIAGVLAGQGRRFRDPPRGARPGHGVGSVSDRGHRRRRPSARSRAALASRVRAATERLRRRRGSEGLRAAAAREVRRSPVRRRGSRRDEGGDRGPGTFRCGHRPDAHEGERRGTRTLRRAPVAQRRVSSPAHSGSGGSLSSTSIGRSSAPRRGP